MEGACPSSETGCGEQRPQVEASSKYVTAYSCHKELFGTWLYFCLWVFVAVVIVVVVL
jgi:hypothetical protein